MGVILGRYTWEAGEAGNLMQDMVIGDVAGTRWLLLLGTKPLPSVFNTY